MKKFLSLSTLACFLVSFVFGEAVQAAVSASRETAQEERLFTESIIPLSAGRITDSALTGSKQVVVNIQDLHCHAEVQRNIAGILSALDKRYGLDRVYVEGGYGTVDTSWLRSVNDKALRKEVAGKLVEQGKLTGSEYYSVLADRPRLLRGIEDEKIHKENIVRLGKLLERKDAIGQKIREMERDLVFMKARHFSVQNKRFDSLVTRYRDGKIPAAKYYALLLKYADAAGDGPSRLAIDKDDYPSLCAYIALSGTARRLNYRRASLQMRQFLQELKTRIPYGDYNALLNATGNFSRLEELYACLPALAREHRFDLHAAYPELALFLAHFEQSRQINPVRLVKEEKRLVEELRLGFSHGIGELEVSFLADFFGYFKDYLSNSITADDLACFTRQFDTFKTTWGKYAPVDRLPGLADDLALLEKYYAVNCARNDCFLRNIDELRDAQAQTAVSPSAGTPLPRLLENSSLIVVVTGGFHSEGLKALLKERGLSRITITPAVTLDTRTSDRVYSELAMRQAKLFGAQGLALELGSQDARVVSVTSNAIVIDIDGTRTVLRRGRNGGMKVDGAFDKLHIAGTTYDRRGIEEAVGQALRIAEKMRELPNPLMSAELIYTLVKAFAVWAGREGIFSGDGLIWAIAANEGVQRILSSIERREGVAEEELGRVGEFFQEMIKDHALAQERIDRLTAGSPLLKAVVAVPEVQALLVTLKTDVQEAAALPDGAGNTEHDSFAWVTEYYKRLYELSDPGSTEVYEKAGYGGQQKFFPLSNEDYEEFPVKEFAGKQGAIITTSLGLYDSLAWLTRADAVVNIDTNRIVNEVIVPAVGIIVSRYATREEILAYLLSRSLNADEQARMRSMDIKEAVEYLSARPFDRELLETHVDELARRLGPLIAGDLKDRERIIPAALADYFDYLGNARLDVFKRLSADHGNGFKPWFATQESVDYIRGLYRNGNVIGVSGDITGPALQNVRAYLVRRHTALSLAYVSDIPNWLRHTTHARDAEYTEYTILLELAVQLHAFELQKDASLLWIGLSVDDGCQQGYLSSIETLVGLRGIPAQTRPESSAGTLAAGHGYKKSFFRMLTKTLGLVLVTAWLCISVAGSVPAPQISLTAPIQYGIGNNRDARMPVPAAEITPTISPEAEKSNGEFEKSVIETLTQVRRLPGTDEHSYAAGIIIDYLKSLGYSTRESNDSPYLFYNQTQGMGYTYIAGVLPGKTAGKNIVLCAHFDSYFQGADDNASGVAALMTMAREYISGSSDATLYFVFTGDEESNHYGVRAFLKDTAILPADTIVINIDSIGYSYVNAEQLPEADGNPPEQLPEADRNPQICVVPANAKVGADYRSGLENLILNNFKNAPFYFNVSPFEEIVAPGSEGASDAAVFALYGFPAVTVSSMLPYSTWGVKVLDSEDDTVEKLDFARIHEVIEWISRGVKQTAGWSRGTSVMQTEVPVNAFKPGEDFTEKTVALFQDYQIEFQPGALRITADDYYFLSAWLKDLSLRWPSFYKYFKKLDYSKAGLGMNAYGEDDRLEWHIPFGYRYIRDPYILGENLETTYCPSDYILVHEINHLVYGLYYDGDAATSDNAKEYNETVGLRAPKLRNQLELIACDFADMFYFGRVRNGTFLGHSYEVKDEATLLSGPRIDVSLKDSVDLRNTFILQWFNKFSVNVLLSQPLRHLVVPSTLPGLRNSEPTAVPGGKNTFLDGLSAQWTVPMAETVLLDATIDGLPESFAGCRETVTALNRQRLQAGKPAIERIRIVQCDLARTDEARTVQFAMDGHGRSAWTLRIAKGMDPERWLNKFLQELGNDPITFEKSMEAVADYEWFPGQFTTKNTTYRIRDERFTDLSLYDALRITLPASLEGTHARVEVSYAPLVMSEEKNVLLSVDENGRLNIDPADFGLTPDQLKHIATIQVHLEAVVTENLTIKLEGFKKDGVIDLAALQKNEPAGQNDTPNGESTLSVCIDALKELWQASGMEALQETSAEIARRIVSTADAKNDLAQKLEKEVQANGTLVKEGMPFKVIPKKSFPGSWTDRGGKTHVIASKAYIRNGEYVLEIHEELLRRLYEMSPEERAALRERYGDLSPPLAFVREELRELPAIEKLMKQGKTLEEALEAYHKTDRNVHHAVFSAAASMAASTAMLSVNPSLLKLSRFQSDALNIQEAAAAAFVNGTGIGNDRLARRHVTRSASHLRQALKLLENADRAIIDENTAAALALLYSAYYLEEKVGRKYIDEVMENVGGISAVTVKRLIEFKDLAGRLRLVSELTGADQERIRKIWNVIGTGKEIERAREAYLAVMHKVSLGGGLEDRRRKLVRTYGNQAAQPVSCRIDPLILGITPTLACAGHCRHCQVINVAGGQKGKMTKDERIAVYRQLLSYAANKNIPGLVISGGESLSFAIDDVLAILENCELFNEHPERWPSVSITTNADFAKDVNAAESMLSKLQSAFDRATWLLSKKPPLTLQISLDSFHQEIISGKDGSLRERASLTNIANVIESVYNKFPEIEISIISNHDGNSESLWNELKDELERRGYAIAKQEYTERKEMISLLEDDGQYHKREVPGDFRFEMKRMGDAGNGSKRKIIRFASQFINPVGHARYLAPFEYAVADEYFTERLVSGRSKILNPRGDAGIDARGNMFFGGGITTNLWSIGNVMEDGIDAVFKTAETDPLIVLLQNDPQMLLVWAQEAMPFYRNVILAVHNFNEAMYTMIASPAMRLYLTERALEAYFAAGMIPEDEYRKLGLPRKETMINEFLNNYARELTEIDTSVCAITGETADRGVLPSDPLLAIEQLLLPQAVLRNALAPVKSKKTFSRKHNVPIGVFGSVPREFYARHGITPFTPEQWYSDIAIALLWDDYAQAVEMLMDFMEEYDVPVPTYFRDRTERLRHLLFEELRAVLSGEPVDQSAVSLREGLYTGMVSEETIDRFGETINAIMKNVAGYLDLFSGKASGVRLMELPQPRPQTREASLNALAEIAKGPLNDFLGDDEDAYDRDCPANSERRMDSFANIFGKLMDFYGENEKDHSKAIVSHIGGFLDSSQENKYVELLDRRVYEAMLLRLYSVEIEKDDLVCASGSMHAYAIVRGTKDGKAIIGVANMGSDEYEFNDVVSPILNLDLENLDVVLIMPKKRKRNNRDTEGRGDPYDDLQQCLSRNGIPFKYIQTDSKNIVAAADMYGYVYVERDHNNKTTVAGWGDAAVKTEDASQRDSQAGSSTLSENETAADNRYDLLWNAPKDFIESLRNDISLDFIGITWQLFRHLKKTYNGKALSSDYRSAFIQMLKHHKIASLLDVGYGDGRFLAQIKPLCDEAGVQLYGIDRAGTYAEDLVRKGINVIKGDAADFRAFGDRKYDAIVCSDAVGFNQLDLAGNRNGSRLAAAKDTSMTIAGNAVASLSDNSAAAVFVRSHLAFSLLDKDELTSFEVRILYWNTDEMHRRDESGPAGSLKRIESLGLNEAEKEQLVHCWEQGANVAVLAKGQRAAWDAWVLPANMPQVMRWKLEGRPVWWIAGKAAFPLERRYAFTHPFKFYREHGISGRGRFIGMVLMAVVSYVPVLAGIAAVPLLAAAGWGSFSIAGAAAGIAGGILSGGLFHWIWDIFAIGKMQVAAVNHIVRSDELRKEIGHYRNDQGLMHVWFTDLPATLDSVPEPLDYKVSVPGAGQVKVWTAVTQGKLVFYMDLKGVPQQEYDNALAMGAAQLMAQLGGTDTMEENTHLAGRVRAACRAQKAHHVPAGRLRPVMAVDHIDTGKVRHYLAEWGMNTIVAARGSDIRASDDNAAQINARIRKILVKDNAVSLTMAENKMIDMDYMYDAVAEKTIEINDLHRFRKALDKFNIVGKGQMLVDWERIFAAPLREQKITEQEIKDILVKAKANGVGVFCKVQTADEMPFIDKGFAGVIAPRRITEVWLDAIGTRQFSPDEVLDIRIPASMTGEQIRSAVSSLPPANAMILHSGDASRLIGTGDFIDRTFFASLLNMLVHSGNAAITTPQAARRLGYNWDHRDLPPLYSGAAGRRQVLALSRGEVRGTGIAEDSAIYEQAAAFAGMETSCPGITKAFLRAIAEKMLIREKLAAASKALAAEYDQGSFKIAQPAFEETLGCALLQRALMDMPQLKRDKSLAPAAKAGINESINAFILKTHKSITNGCLQTDSVTAVIDIILNDMLTDHRIRKTMPGKPGTFDPRIMKMVSAAA